MMLEESVIDKLDAAAHLNNIKGYTPWVSFLKNENNRIFTEFYFKAFQKNTNLFVELGWDAGLLLQAILEKVNTGITSAAEIVSALGNTTFNSPRGWLKFDPATNHTFGPAWLTQYNSETKLTIEETFTESENEWQEFITADFSEGESSGWRNTYLCI